MNDIMSYQYPPPGTPPPPYDAGYSIPPHSSGMDTGSPGQSGRNESEPSPTSFELKRSSHPDVRMVERAPGPDQANMGASGDKKRGKLQYQRISVACTNCRRRKIRCVQAAGAPKCNQCKRLHKDCVVEAVDQRNPADTRHKPVSRPLTGQKLASASSSPAMSSGRSAGMHAARPHGGMGMPSIQHMALADPADVRMAQGASIGRAYPEYGSPGMTNWMAPDASPGSSRARAPNASWTPYSQGSAIAPSYSPYNHPTPPSGSWAAAPVPGDSSTRDGMHWGTYPPPNPSFTAMSQMTASAYGRRTPNSMPPAEMYPSVPSMGSPHMGQAAPLSPPQPASHVAGFGSWQQQPYPPPMPKAGDSFGSWYPESEGSQSQPGPSGAVQPHIEHGTPTTEGYYSHR